MLLKLSILFGLGREQLARQGGHALISLNAFEQRSNVRHPFGGSEPELGGVAADGVAQLRAIADKPIAEADQHQGCLLLGRLNRHETHRWPAHRLA